MKQNKLTWFFSIFILALIIMLGVLFFKNKILEKRLDNWARLTNSLSIERDFEIYNALKQKDIIKIKRNLDLNFMFHLSAIETDSIANILDMQSITRLCKKYNLIKIQFKNEYEKKYPSSVSDLDLFCK